MAAEKNVLSKISDFLIPYHSCTYVSKLSQEEIFAVNKCIDRFKKRPEDPKDIEVKTPRNIELLSSV